MSRRVLVVSAHPDDETLGCGGTLLKQKAAGDDIYWLIVTSPWVPMFKKEFLEIRKNQINKVKEAYAFSDVFELGFPTARLAQADESELISKIRKIGNEIFPDIVYVVNRHDVHSDHRVTFDATWAAFKSFAQKKPADIICFETVSSTNMAAPYVGNQFIPNMYSGINEFIDEKIRIFGLYETEKQIAPGPRSDESIRALAMNRGTVIGAEYAEAFMLMRAII